jgi:ApaG protein
MYKAVTRGIRVTVMPRFVEEESAPDQQRFFFAYTVEITNMSTERVQLRSRHWRIVDGRGQLQEVRGPGVVGKQPELGPGETFSYTSGCPLTTPDGTM